MRICLTGGIACGKSLFASLLKKRGVEILDADDVVHSIIPAEERRRLAGIVFNDASARKALEARVHPLVRRTLAQWSAARDANALRVEVVPLVYEVGWEGDYDRIAAIVSSPEAQIARMVETRGCTHAEARARIDAQMPVDEKARRADYVIANNGAPVELEIEASRFLDWLRGFAAAGAASK